MNVTYYEYGCLHSYLSYLKCKSTPFMQHYTAIFGLCVCTIFALMFYHKQNKIRNNLLDIKCEFFQVVHPRCVCSTMLVENMVR